MPTSVSMSGLSKGFTGVQALQDVAMDIRAGEVLALLGENGAGKSTLLKILSGEHAPDEGEIRLNGQPVTFRSSGDSRRSGIRVIAQEPEIIKHVSVAENIFVGNLKGEGRVFSERQLMRATQELLEEFGFDAVLDPTALGSSLSPAQRQIVEIMRGLVGRPTVVAFDEPTSSLTEEEVDALFVLIDRLRESGVAIVYVSHRMAEIFRIADRVAVLRDGKLVGVKVRNETSESELVKMMVGRDLGSLYRRSPVDLGDIVLDVKRLNSDLVHEVSLTVRAGEVVALAGLIGAGRSELARTIVGDLPRDSGEVFVDGVSVSSRSPAHAINAGIGLAPEERKAQALLMQRSVRDNMSLAILGQISRFQFVRTKEERRIVTGLIERMRVRTPSIEVEIRTLSGGNQQKAVLGRWIARRPKVLILDEPTRGVDVGAKAEIYGLIDELAQTGVAVLMISSELPEVIGLADRILVMEGGRIVGELDRDSASEEKVLSLALPDRQGTTAS